MKGLPAATRPGSLWSVAAVLGFAVLLAACRSPVASAEHVEKGRSLYAANCQSCHGDAASGVGAVPGAPSHGIDGHTWHHADGQLAGIVLGRLDYPGRTMPSFADKLSEEDVQDILAYFKINWLPEQRISQREASKNWEQTQGARR